MKVLITGANGFIGKNLRLFLAERKDIEVICLTREHDALYLSEQLEKVDFIFHLAGVNRPEDPQEFLIDNKDFTQALSAEISKLNRKISVVYTSSIHAEENDSSPYGLSKRAGEEALFNLEEKYGVSVYVFRLPNVFGKWCKPNYNSVVATFCHNIARDLPIHINDPATSINLVYIDDVIEHFMKLMEKSDCNNTPKSFSKVSPQYTVTLGELASHIKAFKESRLSLMTERVGFGFTRALYSTYLSYLPAKDFIYQIPQHEDARGIFVEMLKTTDSGQFSYFTARPGITRGGHYHHSKTEKFLVVKGRALFKFRHMQTGEIYELLTSDGKAEIVETIPGWTHDITNIGNDEMIVMLWANEVYNKSKPDTFSCEV